MPWPFASHPNGTYDVAEPKKVHAPLPPLAAVGSGMVCTTVPLVVNSTTSPRKAAVLMVVAPSPTRIAAIFPIVNGAACAALAQSATAVIREAFISLM